MLALTTLCQIFVIFGTIIQTVRSEECIRWQNHEKELSNCCKWDPPYPRESMHQCSQSATEQVTQDKQEFYRCLFECYFEELGIVVDQTLNVDKLSGYLQALSEEVRNHVIDTYKKCAAETTNTLRVCNSFAQELEMCALEEIGVGCPDEIFTPGEICDKRRSGVKFCQDPPQD